MRLLHVADFLLGNANYRREVRDANGIDLIDLDRRAAFDRAVGCAIEHDVDVVVVAGGLLDGRRGELAPYRAWLDERISQLRAAGIDVVVYDPAGVLAELDVAVVTDDDWVDVAGVRFTPVSRARDAAASIPTDLLTVAVGRGTLKRAGGDAAFEPLDDRFVVDVSRDVSYVALGGMLECRPLTANAWICGAACGLFAYHPGTPGGIIVQLGRSTGRVLDLIHVRWESRRRVSVTIDAGGMDASTLAAALHAHLDEACMSVDAHEPIDADHPLARLYGAPTGLNGVGWWSRPIIEVKVRHAACLPGEVWRSNPLLPHILANGEHLTARFRWVLEDGGDIKIPPFTPVRRPAHAALPPTT